MSDCLFCKIAEGQIPSNKVYEDEVCFAFMTSIPALPTFGYPQGPYRICGRGDRGQRRRSGPYFRSHLQVTKELGLDSYRVVSNIGEQAGQSVPHLHFHVLSGRDMTWPPG